MWAERARLYLATLWAGSLWTIGYVVAPTLFGTLTDSALAGTLAGSMFRSESWLALVCGVLLLALLWGARAMEPARRLTLLLVVLAMLACSLVCQFVIFPWIAGLREAAGPGGVAGTALAARFGMLHGMSMLIYMVQSLLGGLLIWKLVPANRL